MSLPKADRWFMFAGNKYVNTNQIFSADKVASDPYQSLIYITNEAVIEKQKGFWQHRKLGVADLQPPQCITLQALWLRCSLYTASSTVSKQEKLLSVLRPWRPLNHLFWFLLKNLEISLHLEPSYVILHPHELQDCTCPCISQICALHD